MRIDHLRAIWNIAEEKLRQVRPDSITGKNASTVNARSDGAISISRTFVERAIALQFVGGLLDRGIRIDIAVIDKCHVARQRLPVVLDDLDTLLVTSESISRWEGDGVDARAAINVLVVVLGLEV